MKLILICIFFCFASTCHGVDNERFVNYKFSHEKSDGSTSEYLIEFVDLSSANIAEFKETIKEECTVTSEFTFVSPSETFAIKDTYLENAKSKLVPLQWKGLWFKRIKQATVSLSSLESLGYRGKESADYENCTKLVINKRIADFTNHFNTPNVGDSIFSTIMLDIIFVVGGGGLLVVGGISCWAYFVIGKSIWQDRHNKTIPIATEAEFSLPTIESAPVYPVEYHSSQKTRINLKTIDELSSAI